MSFTIGFQTCWGDNKDKQNMRDKRLVWFWWSSYLEIWCKWRLILWHSNCPAFWMIVLHHSNLLEWNNFHRSTITTVTCFATSINNISAPRCKSVITKKGQSDESRNSVLLSHCLESNLACFLQYNFRVLWVTFYEKHMNTAWIKSI